MQALLLCFLLVAGWSTPVFSQQLKEITNSIEIKLVLIHAGSFTMGSPAKEVGRIPIETPHEVTITKPFYLGVYEVTQDQYEKVMGKNPSGFKGAKNPVDTVNWDDAVSFCKKLSESPEEKAAGRVYRGGSWSNVSGYCRSAYRDGSNPSNPRHNYGFRLHMRPPVK